MKKFLFIFLLTAFLSACNDNPGSTEKKQSTKEAVEKVPDENLLSIRFDVTGMKDSSSDQTINKSVNELPGIVEVKASYQDSTAVVKFDKSKTSISDITTAIEQKGYHVDGYQLDM